MSTDPTTSDVALRPWPTATKDGLTQVDLFQQLHQLAEQRGHLRSVTEKSLQEEIDSGKDITGDVVEGVEKEDDDNDEKAQTREERLVELGNTRVAIRMKLEYAKFAAQNALDLISLALSNSQNTNLATDPHISQGLKQLRIPRGSFAIQRSIDQPQTQSNPALVNDNLLRADKLKLASRGGRMLALDSAVDHLLQSATHLETEIRKETKYWEHILSLSQKGWSIRRQRKDQRFSPLLVEFGHPEASGQFKARGTAPLRMNDDGGIILDPSLRLKPKTLRVRIKVGEKVIGTSSLPTQGSTADLDIEHAVRFARTSLFEEELFHSITLESRHLLAYGVEQRDSIVHLPLPGAIKKTVLIDCVPGDNESAINVGSQDWLAQLVADALRLLMEYEHRLRLNRRSRIPPPLTQQRRSHSDPPLLHSILAIFNHINAVDSLRDYLDNVVQVLKSAGVDAKLTASRESTWDSLVKTVTEPARNGLTGTDQLLAAFIKPLDGKVTLSLPSSNETDSQHIVIATRTSFNSPTYGTGFKITIPSSLASVLYLAQEQSRDYRMSSVDEVKSYIDWVLSLDLSHSLLFKEYPDQAVLTSKEPQVTIVKKDGKKKVEQEVTVDLADGKLEVTVTSFSQSVRTFIWDGSEGKPSLKDEVRKSIG